MKTKQFKTNINCMGCIRQVTPILNEVVGENKWDVNLQHKDKILTVPVEHLQTEKVVERLTLSGFTVELIKE